MKLDRRIVKPWALHEREIHRARFTTLKSPQAGGVHDADDPQVLSVRKVRHIDCVSDWIGVWKSALGETFTNHRHTGPVFVVVPLEVAASQRCHAHRTEEAWTDEAHGRTHRVGDVRR